MSEQSEMSGILEDLKGAKYVGTRYPLCTPQGQRIEMHIVSITHPNGDWEAIYCRTRGQAECIAALTQANAKKDTALREHLEHVQRFLQEMYSIMVDPCEGGPTNVADMCKLLIHTAVEQRQLDYDQANALAEKDRTCRTTPSKSLKPSR